MRPLSQGKFQYLLGNDLLVAPVYVDQLERDVSLPEGRWRYLFHDDEQVTGPATLRRDFPLDEFPVFIREGAIIPLDVARPYSGFGDTNSAGFTTWLIYPAGKHQFTMSHPQSHPNPEQTTLSYKTGPALKLEFSGKHQPHILRILSQSKPSRVTLDGIELPEGPSWNHDAAHHRLIIKASEYSGGQYEIVTPAPER
jgi:hypothetical protein